MQDSSFYILRDSYSCYWDGSFREIFELVYLEGLEEYPWSLLFWKLLSVKFYWLYGETHLKFCVWGTDVTNSFIFACLFVWDNADILDYTLLFY